MSNTEEASFWGETKKKWGEVFLIIPALLFLSIFLFYPLFRLLSLSLFDPTFTLKHFFNLFRSPLYMQVLRITLQVSLIVTISCLLLGYPLAYTIVSVSNKWAAALIALVIMCFWTSILIRSYAWMALLQRTGVVNVILIELGWIKNPIKLMYNLFGVTVGMTHVLLPFMILPLYGVMKGIDRSLLKAAQNLGASPFQSFWKVFVPLSLPGVAAGCILVFVIALGFFITPALLGGGNVIMISNLIDIQVSELLNWGFASAISIALIIVTLVIFYISNRYLGLARMWSA